MRKHFLLLFLMALLPLAGWAQEPTPYDGEYPVDLSNGWAIQLVPASKAYDGNVHTPVVRLVKGDEYIPSTKFSVSWNVTEIREVSNVGYTVTVTNDMTNTIKTLAEPTAEYWVLKANNAISTAPTMATTPITWTGASFPLVTAAGVATFGDVEFIVSADEPAANAAGWSTTIPEATNPGSYKVWYRAPGTSNYNASAAVALGTVVINGQNPTVTTAPEAVAGLKYNGTPKNLVTQGVVSNGTLKYRSKFGAGEYGEWGTSVPQGTEGGNYTVQWMVEGNTGYNNINPTEITNAIGAADVSITANPAAASSLTFNGSAQSLITTPGTAQLNAPLKYTVTYKAPDADGFTAFLNEVAFTEVKAINAGTYRVVAKVIGSANYNATSGANVDVTIAQADAFTAAPTAKDLRYTGLSQQLIEAGVGTAADDAVLYKLGEADYTNDITAIKASAVNNYTVKYKVINTNYKPVPETTIQNVKIKGALLTVKVNNITKVYDGTVNIKEAVAEPAAPANYTVDGGKNRVEFISSLPGYTTNGDALNYAAVTAINYATAGYPGVVTVNEAAYKTANPNYDVTFIHGNLTIAQKELYVQAKNQTALTTTVGDVYTLDNQYDVYGIVNTDEPWQAGKAPVLKSDAPAQLHAGEYNLSWTEGTLKVNGNYKMRAENPYVITEGLKFKVNAAAGSKVVVTVYPHDKEYGSADPDYTSWVEGVDYYVSGLIGGDNVHITFSRAAGEVYKAGGYELTATATVDNPTWYDEAVAVTPSTFTITPKELTATVAQQIIVTGAATLPDPNAWNVTGLVNGVTINNVEINDTKADLVGTLSFNEGTKKITLAITNPNYTLKEGTETGTLVVIDASTLALNPNDANLVGSINTAAAAATPYKITFMDQTPAAAAKTLKAGQWNTLVLPFETTVAEVSAALGYAVVDVLDETNDDPDAIKLKLAFGNLPAHKPFLVQPAADIKLSEVVYWNADANKKAIVAVPDEIAASDGGIQKYHSFVGTYANYKVMPDATNEYFYSTDQKKFINSTRTGGTTITVFGAYLVDNTNKARQILVEEPDGSVTAISTINAEGVAVRAEGWYTLNGVKLQGVPTEKGIYINNGKKVVIK